MQRILQAIRFAAFVAQAGLALLSSLATIAALTSGLSALALSAAFSAVFWAPLAPTLVRMWRRRSLAAVFDYHASVGALVGVVLVTAALGLFLSVSGPGPMDFQSSEGERRIGNLLGAMIALWLSTLVFELARRR